MRIASYNCHKMVGTDGRFRPDRVASVIAEIGADIVALQEVDRRFGRRTGLLDETFLRSEGYRIVPVSDIPDGHGWHGNALLIRDSVSVVTARRLSLPGFEPRGALAAEVRAGGSRLVVICAHFGLLPGCRARQAEAVLREVRSISAGAPAVLLGDLNEWRPRARSLQVLCTLFGSPGGLPSFPARCPVMALDRILGSLPGLVTGMAVHDTALARRASDHLPVKARLDLSAAWPELAA